MRKRHAEKTKSSGTSRFSGGDAASGGSGQLICSGEKRLLAGVSHPSALDPRPGRQRTLYCPEFEKQTPGSRILDNGKDANYPLIWMVGINGLSVDIRHAPRHLQESAFNKGLIPYIPADRMQEE